MELTLRRIERDRASTLGKLFHGDQFLCYILEDVDRGLLSTMTAEEIRKVKVYGKTAIPYGRYEINCTYSPRFKRVLPQLLGVKGFSGIRIHRGLTAEHTEGCLLTGADYTHIVAQGFILKDSKTAFDLVYKLIGETLLKERIFITITK
jgi:hypothetical protein